MQGIALRGYRADDLAALYAMDVVCFEEPFRFSRAAMRRFAEAAKARVLVAEADVVVGFCIVHVERHRVAYVVTLDVAPQWRGRGIARGMLTALEGQCAMEGCATMCLHVHVGNAEAIAFYARCGYASVGREAGFYGVGEHAMVYSKTL